VRRDDLVQSDASCSQPQSPNASLQAQYLERLGAQYNLPATGPTLEAEEATVEDPVGQKGAGHPTDGYDFRLFLKSARPRAPTDPDEAIQRITLRSPTPGNDEPGFIISRRPDKYYFIGSVSSEQADQYRQAAVSYEDLITWSRTRWRGCELPWRVTVFKSSISSKVLKVQHTNVTSNAKKRTRSGKKRRIVIRKHKAKEMALKSVAQRSQAEKEEAEKDKRNKKNRERKMKRRQKEREKKAQQLQEIG
ncbi:MAG: hypothetical protein Q9164_006798, partial [Protoblastenia rupestris]